MRELSALEITCFYIADKPDCHLHIPNPWEIVQRCRHQCIQSIFEIFILKEVIHKRKETRLCDIAGTCKMGFCFDGNSDDDAILCLVY